ncbi:EAL domain-containing protein [Mycolicibacterium sp. Y3]
MPRFAWVASAATVTTAAWCAWLMAGWGGPDVVSAADDLGFVAVSGFATSCAGYTAWRALGRQRLAWIFITIGLFGWTVGSAVWAYYEWWLGTAPFPSLADAGYLMFPVFVCAGLLVLPVGASGYTYTRLVLDGVIVAGSLFVVAWFAVVRQMFANGGATTFEVGLSLAYPLTDLVVVTVALLVLARARPGNRAPLVLLTAGVVLMALADCGWAYLISHDDYRTVSVVDLGWAWGLLLIGVGALLSSHLPRSHVDGASAPTAAALWVPYVPLAVAMVIGVANVVWVPELAPALVAFVLLVSAVVFRQVIVVGENRRLLANAEAQAMRDPLTGLANRALFQDRLTHALLLHRRDKQPVAVLSLDLDDFKLVNDGLGHPTGDILLTSVAERIVGAARSSDTVARLGGDEFAVLLEGDAEQSIQVAQRIAAGFGDPFAIEGHYLPLRPSAGLAIAAPEGPELSAEALMERADVAMYSAKRARAREVRVFSAEMQRAEGWSATRTPVDGAATLQMLGELRSAIDNDDLILMYQPKFDLRDESIVGVEALLRWPHPSRGLLAPDEFLALVREHGLIRSVTELVVTQALDQAALWRDHGFTVPIAVNLFAPSLADLTMSDRIVRALDERGLACETLTVEVTEDLLLDNVDRTRAVIETLRGSGVRVALDDFGSGYSTLAYLRDLPIDEIKLDRDFVSAVRGDRRAGVIVRTVVALAHELGMTTVAEGIENAETVALLHEYGCRYAQGYFYSEPLSAAAMLELLTARRRARGAVISS